MLPNNKSPRLEWLEVIGSKQKLLGYANEIQIIREYNIATSKFGFGERLKSYQTPRGWHEIVEKIGHNCPMNSVFVGRKTTGEIYHADLKRQFPERDWILTRILWLSGLEKGKNLDGEVDTKARYIYIHGTPDDVTLGVPSSHGCMRMHNEDLVDLFDLVDIGTKVLITE